MKDGSSLLAYSHVYNVLMLASEKNVSVTWVLLLSLIYMLNTVLADSLIVLDEM